MKKIKQLFLFLICLTLFLFSSVTGHAQAPANDDCSKASIINIANNGFGLGTFKSTEDDISKATVQNGETFDQAIFSSGLDQKSIWYKFTIPTKRLVSVTLLQPGSAIQAGDAGFAIYKSNDCLPSKTYEKFTPIAKFGTSAFPCVDSGVYLIQVSSKATANGKVYIQLYLSDSTGGTVDVPVYADYDKYKAPYEFSAFPNNVHTLHVDYDVHCQTVEDANEVCNTLFNYKQYTKSTWHTFTTPAYFDYMAILLNTLLSNGYCGAVNGQQTVGYRLYKGNSTAGLNTLTAVGTCDSLSVNSGYYSDYKLFKCDQLEPNTTYTLQLFFPYNFDERVRLTVSYNGDHPTLAPEPVLNKIPASNQLGTLPEGETKAVDYFGCNSRHSLHPCGFALPKNGSIASNNTSYNLSTFYTFKLTSSANVNINAYVYQPYYPGVLLRLYQQAADNNCNTLDSAHLVLQTLNNGAGSVNCLDPGTYTLQISGTDSLRIEYTSCGNSGSPNPLYLLSHLGQEIDLSVKVDYVTPFNKYSLHKNGSYDSINVVNNIMQSLQNGVTYTASPDTFGCSNTVLPPSATGNYCGYTPAADKAIYRELIIGDADGDNKADSGVISLSNLYGASYGTYMTHIFYRGDANALALQQHKYNYPDTLKGLEPFTQCLYTTSCYARNVCVTPGTYTLVTLGNDSHVGSTPYLPNIQFNIRKTAHYSGATAQNLGNIIDTIGGPSGTVTSDKDYYACTDNAITIDGFAPPIANGDTATKAIYRQFYLSSASIVNICANYYYDCNWYNSTWALFTGKATDGLDKLKKMDWGFCQSLTCNPLPAGWYTIVSYGSGPTYKEPLKNTHEYDGNAVGKYDQFYISISPGCPGPKYNRPYKAAIDTLTKQPFLIEWKERIGSTAAYPVTDTTYNLYQENFNCTVDTPFAAWLKPCTNTVNRVAFYVFKLTKESYVKIYSGGLWGTVFNKDIRKDSLQFGTLEPIQPCIQSYDVIQICKLQPGTYTLVLFAGDNNVGNGCGSVAPTIYVDRVGYSRFDHANNAYDFGVIPADSTFYNGKVGDKNPLNAGRAPSNDFFFCTTGSQVKDPTEATTCYTFYDSLVYKKNINNYLFTSEMNYNGTYQPRRNLWYTFVVDKPGYVRVRVNNKTPDKMTQYGFAVYKSDVDGKLPFADVVSKGLVDSTIDQGLSFVVHNHTYYYCYNYNQVEFYNEPCDFNAPIRYYVLVENMYDLQPNSQAEVEILLDSASAIKTKFDHYYQADTIGLNLGTGTYVGHKDNFMCATADINDPVYYSCAPKTLWYKFTVTQTGHIKFRGVDAKGQSIYGYNNIELFREMKAGDSTKTGLVATTQYPASVNVLDTATGTYNYFNSQCISPGTYYLLFTGCSQPAGDVEVFPQIIIEEEAGDFCSAPVVSTLNKPDTIVSSAIIDCHTIGTDYGEFAPTLSCPSGGKTSDYKSTWFRIDITGKDTLDITTFISENTNAGSADIKYRMMTGDCGAMQEQSCVQDALTQNTYRCLAPGSYYLQVFTPVLKDGYQVVGTVDLHVQAVPHADTCKPDKNCLATARFTSQFDCTTDTAVQFVNYSTYGSSITYKWDFGYKNATSASVSPTFFYPALNVDSTYKVKLVVDNVTCNKQDMYETTVKVPARPYVNLGPDLHICKYDTTILLHATSFAGATYQWSTGWQDSVVDISAYKNYNKFAVQVQYNNCISKDTINIFINPISKNPTQTYTICPADSVNLNANRGYGESYLWNNGSSTNSIYAKDSGLYWVDVNYQNCVFRDSFAVSSLGNAHPLGKDTSLCLSSKTLSLNATVTGASGYLWQDGTYGPSYTVTNPGIYWVDISTGNCSTRDSISVSSKNLDSPIVKGSKMFCEGDSTTLDAGTGYSSYYWNTGDTTRILRIKNAGSYNVTVSDNSGCSAVSGTMDVSQRNNPTPQISGPITFCDKDSTILDAGAGYVKYLWSSGDTTQKTIVRKTGNLSISVTDTSGCKGTASIGVIQSAPVSSRDIAATICLGKVYTLPSGKTADTNGVYIDTLRYTSGCDSIIIKLLLKVLAPVTRNVDTAVCAGSSYQSPSGKLLNVSGIYSDTIHTTNGCDSIISSIALRVKTVARQTIDTISCGQTNFTLPWGTVVNSSGTYDHTVQDRTGCDSLTTIVNLRLQNATENQLDATICSGQTYTLPGGLRATTAGNYDDTLRSSLGCDSIITHLALNVRQSRSEKINATICFGTVYKTPSGKTYDQTGIYSDTLRSVFGCDSVITNLNLLVTTAVINYQSASICTGQTFTLPWGVPVDRAGEYRDTIHSYLGCDSIINIVNLTVVPLPVTGIQAPSNTVCIGDGIKLTAYGGDSYLWTQGGTVPNQTASSVTVYPTAATIYTVTIHNTQCNITDTASVSISVKDKPVLTISSANNIDCNTASTQLLATGGYQYVWSPSKGLNNDHVANPIASPWLTTTYAVQVTGTNGCKTNDSIVVKVLGGNTVTGYLVPNAFTPNADGLNDCFGVRHWAGVQNLQFAIYDRWGERLFFTTDVNQCWDGTYKGQPMPAAAYVYIITAKSLCGDINRKGTVILIR